MNSEIELLIQKRQMWMQVCLKCSILDQPPSCLYVNVAS